MRLTLPFNLAEGLEYRYVFVICQYIATHISALTLLARAMSLQFFHVAGASILSSLLNLQNREAIVASSDATETTFGIDSRNFTSPNKSGMSPAAVLC